MLISKHEMGTGRIMCSWQLCSEASRRGGAAGQGQLKCERSGGGGRHALGSRDEGGCRRRGHAAAHERGQARLLVELGGQHLGEKSV